VRSAHSRDWEGPNVERVLAEAEQIAGPVAEAAEREADSDF
jgi:hypothetical protein